MKAKSIQIMSFRILLGSLIQIVSLISYSFLDHCIIVPKRPPFHENLS